jgi:hypothetical protein
MEILELRDQLEMVYADTATFAGFVADSTEIFPYSFITANVVNNSISYLSNYITIDKGKNAGIKPDMGVVSEQGVVGIVSTVSELTSAIPYFAFLSVLVTYKFSFGILTFVLICYNIIYIAPFVLLYIVYLLSKKEFDKIYIFFKEKCRKIIEYSIPLLLLTISFIITYNGITNIIDRV